MSRTLYRARADPVGLICDGQRVISKHSRDGRYMFRARDHVPRGRLFLLIICRIASLDLFVVRTISFKPPMHGNLATPGGGLVINAISKNQLSPVEPYHGLTRTRADFMITRKRDR